MHQGTIKNIITGRGFGFIVEPGQPDCFFHCKDLDPSLPFDDSLTGRRVKYIVANTDRGPAAKSVQPAD